MHTSINTSGQVHKSSLFFTLLNALCHMIPETGQPTLNIKSFGVSFNVVKICRYSYDIKNICLF